jgi:4-azaleucine resistance transporter AzlC
LLAGIVAMAPLLVGVVPFAVIFGAVAVANSLSVPGAVAMSAFVFAGSAQFIGASLLGAGVATGFIVFTTFVVNLRHALYSLTLAPNLKHLPQRWLLPLSFLLTDEAFAVVVQRYQRADASPYKHWFYLGAAGALYLPWQLFTWLGLWVGASIPNPERWGLEFTLPLTFIAILVPLVRGRSIVVCIAAAGISSLLLNGLPNKLGLVLSALIGVAAGYLASRLETPKAGTNEQEADAQEYESPLEQAR